MGVMRLRYGFCVTVDCRSAIRQAASLRYQENFCHGWNTEPTAPYLARNPRKLLPLNWSPFVFTQKISF